MFPLVLIKTVFPWRQSEFLPVWFLETPVVFQPLEVGHTVASHF